MTLANLLNRAEKTVKANSPAILTGFGIGGTIITAYLAGAAGWQAARVIDREEAENGPLEDPKERARFRAELTWKLFIPPVLSGAVTIGCILGATSAANRKTAAAASAYTVTERAFAEYREKVVDQIGKNKEQALRDEMAQDSLTASPPKNSEVLVTGNGNVLCCELYTKRYFESDMETLRRAQNDINAKILQELYVTLNEFYYIIGLPQTTQSGDVGWNADRLMELNFSTVITEDGRPCLSFEYNYLKPI